MKKLQPVEMRKNGEQRVVDLDGMWKFEGKLAYIEWNKVGLYGMSARKAIVPAVGKVPLIFEAVVLKNEIPYIQNATCDGYIEEGVIEHVVNTTFGHCGSALCVGDSVMGVHDRGRNAPHTNMGIAFSIASLEIISGNV